MTDRQARQIKGEIEADNLRADVEGLAVENLFDELRSGEQANACTMRRLSVALDNALQEIDLGRRQRLGVIFGRAKQPMFPELPLVAKLVGSEAQALIRRCAGLAIENENPIARLDSFGLIDKRAALFTAFGGLFPLLRLLGRSRDIGSQLNQELVDRVGDCFVGDPVDLCHSPIPSNPACD